jgi:hypothetical protein
MNKTDQFKAGLFFEREKRFPKSRFDVFETLDLRF